MHTGPPRDESPKQREPDREGEPARAMLRTSALGLQVVMTFVVLAVAGTWVDDRFEVGP